MKRIRSIGAVLRPIKTEVPAAPPDKEPPFQHRVKMGLQEINQITQAHKNLTDVTALAQYAILYQNIGWSPVALEAHIGTCLQVDFALPHSTWLNLLMDLALTYNNISLAIRLEPDSRLFVLMVNPAFGQEFLDSLGDWRSPCIARAGDLWENHFFILPPAWCFSPADDHDDKDAPLSVLGPGRVVAVPPSGEPSRQEAWKWLQHPWEQPPRHPAPRLIMLLEEGGYISRQGPLSEEDLPAWDDIFPSICHSSKLLQALLASVANSEHYYRTILSEALQTGFRDPRMLQALLWHAPHGTMQHEREGLHQLSHWAAEIQKLLSAGTSNAEGLSHGREYCLTDPPRAASMPSAETHKPGFPGYPATPSPPADGGNELNFLATLASQLEQQVDELEQQQAGFMAEPGEHVSPSPSPQKNGEDFDELRRAVEKFLSNNPDLLNDN